jgi:hypothetical protein
METEDTLNSNIGFTTTSKLPQPEATMSELTELFSRLETMMPSMVALGLHPKNYEELKRIAISATQHLHQFPIEDLKKTELLGCNLIENKLLPEHLVVIYGSDESYMILNLNTRQISGPISMRPTYKPTYIPFEF